MRVSGHRIALRVALDVKRGARQHSSLAGPPFLGGVMRFALTCCAAACALAPLTIAAQATGSSGRAYTEGPVTEVSYIRTKPGMFDKYMEYLKSTYKKSNEAGKAAGIILDYSVHTSPARTPQDHDVMLVVVYRNWAAFDNLADRADAVANRVMGTTPQQRDVAFIDRGAMREVLGTRRYQVLVLK